MAAILLSNFDTLLLAALGYLMYQIGRRLCRRVGRTGWQSSSRPGPAGLPFVGNAYQIPRDRQWLKFNEWIKCYGEWLLSCETVGDSG